RRIRNCCSPMYCGRILAPVILPRHSTNLPPGSGALAHARSEMAAAKPSGKWSDFSVRLASAAVLGPIALLCLWQGGLAWSLFIAAAIAGLGFEWAKLALLPLKSAGTWFIVVGLLIS